MQNDLISRSDLLKCFCVNKNGESIPEVDCDNFQVSVSIKDIKRIIREQPTAYDVDAVVKELEDIKNATKRDCPYNTGWKSSAECAIEVVKKGGVE